MRCPGWLIAVAIVAISAVDQSMVVAEEVIWGARPTTVVGVARDSVVSSGAGPGPVNADYALAQVLVECFPGQPRIGLPGTINNIITFFENDAPIDFDQLPGAVQNQKGFFEIEGIARINVFIVAGPDDLPFFNDNPDLGIDWNVVFVQNTIDNWIEVRARGLLQLPIPIDIQPGIRYFIGLTPVFPDFDTQPFGGFHLMNEMRFGNESQSAVRQTSPIFDEWFFAGDVFGPPPELFATIDITGPPAFKLGDVNQDGVVNLLDVDPFIFLLNTGGYQKEADIDGDGFVNLLDVVPFVDILSAGS